MKKISFLLLTLLITQISFAQLNLGIKGGVITSKLYTSLSDYNEQSINGYYGGAFLRIKMNKMFLEPELYYIHKGGNLFSSSEDKDYEIRLNSLDVPLLLGLKLIDLKVIKLSAVAGPVASFVTTNSVTYTQGGIHYEDPDISNDLKNINWGLQVGAMMDILMFTIDVRYEIGLNDMLNDNNQLTNNIFLIGIGLKLL